MLEVIEEEKDAKVVFSGIILTLTQHLIDNMETLVEQGWVVTSLNAIQDEAR